MTIASLAAAAVDASSASPNQLAQLRYHSKRKHHLDPDRARQHGDA